MRLGAAVAGGLLVAACGWLPSPVPSPPGNRQSSPAAVGTPTTAVVVYLTVSPGDRMELLAGEAVGELDGAEVRLLLSRPVVEANGDRVIGATTEPMEGAVLTAVSASPGPDNTVGIVAELVARRPGRYTVTGMFLRYRLNGSEVRSRNGVDVRWTVCADTPAPTACSE